VRERGISAVARALDVTPQTISQRVRIIERGEG
jgi:DNA-binding transcriptional LysR family regulator